MQRRIPATGYYSTVPGDFRIVRERRGDLIVGFRVQEFMVDRRNGDTYWSNRGSRCYSQEQAETTRDFYVTRKGFASQETTYEEV